MSRQWNCRSAGTRSLSLSGSTLAADNLQAGTLLTLGVLVPLLGFFLLANELAQVGVAGYRLQDALLFMVLSLPRYAYQVFPIATLIGALLGLGALANRSELVAMRAAGVSVGRIAGAGLLGGVVLAAGAMLIGEVVVTGLGQNSDRSVAGIMIKAVSEDRPAEASTSSRGCAPESRSGLTSINIPAASQVTSVAGH